MRTSSWLLVGVLLSGCNVMAGLDELQFTPDQTGSGAGSGGGAAAAPLVCPGGDPASGDADQDGLCDDVDPCMGADNASDVDADGVCDSLDLCAGDDSFGDGDGDGVCEDGGDPCVGLSNVDGDGDGVCDDLDACPGVTDNGDGTCTLAVAASTEEELAGLLSDTDGYGACPGNMGGYSNGSGSEVWTIHRFVGVGNGYGNMQDAYLSFDTSVVGGTIESATLTITHLEHDSEDTVLLFAPVAQPAWNTIGSGAYASTNVPVAFETVTEIASAGEARFSLPAAKVNAGGLSQFRLSMATCPVAGYAEQNRWTMAAPASATPPRLTVTYTPAP